MQTDLEKKPLFQLDPAIDSIAQLLSSGWRTAGGMTTVYCDLLRNANAQAFELVAALPSAGQIAESAREVLRESTQSIKARSQEIAEEVASALPDDSGVERATKSHTYAAPALTTPASSSKKPRKGSHPMH